MKTYRPLFLALILALCLSLTACSEKTAVSGHVAPSEASAPNVTTGSTAKPESPATEAPVSNENLSLGRLEGGVYTNEYVGYTCALDSNWSFLSAKELEQIPSSVSDAISGTALADVLANTPQFTDMMAENVNDLTSMNVLYQKLSFQERLAYAAMTEEEIIDTTLEQKDMMIEAFEQAGMTSVSIEKVTVTFMGETRTALHTETMMGDIPYYTLQFFDFQLGSYAVTTTLSSYMEDNTGTLMGLFSRLES